MRALLLILVISAALVGGMFASGHTTPRLGIDLAGGTSITLTATDEKGNQTSADQTNLNTAAEIIERRVNGMGVSEAEVQTQGDRNIVVNIPKGTDEEQAREQVGTTAQLAFRPVLHVEGVPIPGEEPPPAEEDTTGEEEATDEGAEEEADPQGDEATEEDPAGEEPTDQGLPAPQGQDGDADATHASFRSDDSADPEPSDTPKGEEEQPADDPVGKLSALDCSTAEARAESSQQAALADDDGPVISCDNEGTAKYALGPVAVPGTDVSGADAVYQPTQGWIVQMEFNSAGAGKFADITSELAGQMQPQNQFAIVLDGEVVSAPRVSERLGGGSASISGTFGQDEADELANILKYGALPITFEEGNVTTVSPMLGGDQLRAGLIAGAIGMALVSLYMLFYYRGLALIALASLVATGGLTYATMSLLGPGIGFALSLPAICGAIVAIGITADSFIVYFERIKDEVREGRSLRAAIERAWPKARRTILISDFVSFLAAVVLFVLSVGTVQGFAFTLGLTTVLEVVVVFLLTRPLMTLLARSRLAVKASSWTGLDPKRLGARPKTGVARQPAALSSEPKVM